ncbi:ATPase, T2SS/T4P/T4SS family [Weissella cibaria]|uniref:ATPase, T2SS/T4P/T4SS family n=1 Tax=Weissella cibaria TaxID=137591 RepID=UPI0021BD21BF|nr:ATPase, T2SS/T4P/T4SS family [Weissella cibaria]
MTTIQAVFSNAIFEAAQHQASDIYIMPKQDGYQVSCYTAGGIVPLDVLTASVGAALIRHIKFEAQMDISEMRRPQLGRWTYQAGDRPLHLRVSSVGDFLNLESVVVRLIVAATDRQIRWVETTPVAELTATLARRQGLVLIAGQMGAGKTTTLHYLADRYFRIR